MEIHLFILWSKVSSERENILYMALWILKRQRRSSRLLFSQMNKLI